MVCADFVNACLADLAADLSPMPGYGGVAGYRYASFLADPRPLDLLPEDVSYCRRQLTLRAGEAGQRDGTLTIMLPLVAAERSGPPVTNPKAPTAPVLLQAVLARRKLSLGELKGLAPGQILSLPCGCLDNATLETATGQVLARGKLGESAGCHALRLRRLDGPGGMGSAVMA